MGAEDFRVLGDSPLPSVETYGNGATSAYDRDNLSRVQSITDKDGDGTQIRMAAFEHDAGGNVTARLDGSQFEVLGYDHLDRLVSSTANTERRAIDYDALGNITTRTELGPYAYVTPNPTVPGVFLNPTKPHAVTQVGTFGDPTFYFYDDAGQLTHKTDASSEQRTSWTPFGKVAQQWTGSGDPEDGTNVVTLGYDADGQRVLKETASETTTYVEDLYEKRARAGITEHVFYVDNGLRVFLQLTSRTDGVSSEGEAAFLHGDVVGSPEVVTGADGELVERRSYGAFGAERDPNDWLASATNTSAVRLGFSSHEEDREHSYVNMNGRLYDPVIARFLSPDPLVATPLSQDLNRYSYVRNNPLKYVDPSGFDPEVVDPQLASSSEEYLESRDPEVEEQAREQAEQAANEAGPNSSSLSDAGVTENRDLMMSDNAGGGSSPLLDALSSAWNAYTEFQEGTLQDKIEDIRRREGSFAEFQMGDRSPSPQEYERELRSEAQGELMAENFVGGSQKLVGGAARAGSAFLESKFGQQLARQLIKDGSASVFKSLRSIEQNLAEHQAKLASLKYKSSVEREIRAFNEQLDTVKAFIEHYGLKP